MGWTGQGRAGDSDGMEVVSARTGCTEPVFTLTAARAPQPGPTGKQPSGPGGDLTSTRETVQKIHEAPS